MRTLLTFLLLLSAGFDLSHGSLYAQELEARVNVNHQQVQGTNTAVFEALQTTLTEFINNRQWTNLQFRRNERITCTFNITVTKYNESENTFECKLIVQSNRPVYGSTYTTTTFSTQDANFNFAFQEFDQLEFRPEALDNELTALIGFYAYLLIGIDLDTMSPMGGTDVLQTAQTIANNAQSFTLSAKGWKAFESDKNRYALINDYLDSGMQDFREMQYKYHREGLDAMSTNVERGRAVVTEAMELLRSARQKKPLSMWPQLLTEYKRDELVNIYKGRASAQEKETVSELLTYINASQSNYWRKIKE